MKKLFIFISILTLVLSTVNGQNITNVTVGDISCNSASTGVINVFTDATVGFDYELELLQGGVWTPFLVNQTAPSFPNFTINGLFAGTFQLTTYVTGGIGGTPVSTWTNIVISQPAPVIVFGAPTVTDVSCFGGNDGTISLFVLGGTTPYTYLWSDGQTTNPAINLSAGTYTCTITDANGCPSITSNATVSQPAAPLSTTITSTPVSCHGDNDGTATVNPSGGTSPYTYLWSDGQTTNPAINLFAGAYTCVITDANGCPITSTSETVTQPAAALVGGITSTDVNCFGGSDGTATASGNNGTPPYIYNWSDGQTTNVAINLFPGTYTCTITDANGCVDIVQAIINQPAAALDAGAARLSFTYPSYNGEDITCVGANDGEAEAWGTNGTPPYSFLWSDGQTTAIATGLAPGSYSCTVTDANGCPALSNTVTLIDPPVLGGSATSTPATCSGDNSGTATANPSGGTPGYTYLWSNGQINQTATSLLAGTYTCDITDANNCTVTITVTVGEPSPLTLTANINNVSCTGGNDGSATVNASGGTPGYSYSWPNGQNTATASGLTFNMLPGYTCTVIDANGCTETITVAINEPATLPTASTNFSMVSCFGGSDGTATVIPTGGTPGYTYVWSDGQTGQPATGLSAGTYTCVVTDANGCDVTESVTVPEPPVLLAINPTAVTNVVCNGQSTGAATVFPTGGMPPYAYTWTGPAPLNTIISNIDNIVNQTVGTYTCHIIDAAGCDYFETVVIEEPDVIGMAVQPIVNNPNCTGGNSGDATVVPNGGVPPYTYLWSDGQTTATASALFAGTYTCQVTDANGCSNGPGANITVILNDPAPITFVDIMTPVLCAGEATGSLSLNVSGGTQFNPPATPYLYSWSNGTTTNFNDFLSAGSYSCQIIDAAGCTTNTGPITVTEPLTALTATIINIVDQSCATTPDGSLTVTTGNTGTPGYTYLWSHGFTGNVASNLLPASYTCTVTDFNGCQVTTAPAVVNAADPLVVTTSFQQPSCNSTTIGVANDGTATAIVSGGTGTGTYFYQWDDPFLQTTETAISLIAGTYTVSVTDGNGCLETAVVTVTEPSPDITASFLTTDIACFGDNTGSITMTVNGGTPPFNYSWVPNGETTATIQNLSAGTYTCNISDATGCITVVNTTIFQNPDFVAPLTAQPMTVLGANDGSMFVAASGGLPPYTYNWVDDATTLSIGNTASINLLGPGTYTCTITDAAGCVIVAQGLIPNPGCALTVTDNISTVNCHGDSAIVSWTNSNGLPPYTNTLLDPNGVPVNLTAIYGTNQFTTNAPSPLLLDAGVYLLTVTDANGCFGNNVAQINLQVVEPDPITMNITTTDVDCHGDFTGTVVAVAGGGTPPLLTTFAVQNSGIPADPNALAAGTYSVTTTDAYNCMESTTFTINEPAAPLTLQISNSTPEGCMPTANGTATVTATGGTLAYSYLWNDLLSQSTPTASGLVAGSYNCVVTDGNGCTETIGHIVPPAPNLSLAYNVTQPTCDGSNNGIIATTFAGGSLPVSYIWEDVSIPGVTLSTNSSISSLSQGVYALSATDLYGCAFSIPAVTITDPAPISISATANNPTLNGACDGSIAVNSVVGGDGNYISYQWIGSGGYSNNTMNISSLCSGTYQLTVTDGNGCVGYAVENIIDPACNVSVTYTLTQPNCFGDAGSLIFNITGGQAPYTSTVTEYGTNLVMYSGLVTPPPPVSLLDGNYYLSVIDNLGCSAPIQDVFVVDPLPLTFSMQLDSATCNGLNNGAATVVSTTGGTPPYNYSWSNNFGNNTPINSGLLAGVYTVEVWDLNNCLSTPLSPYSYSIGEPSPISISPFSFTEPSCNLGGDGMAMVSVTGGTTPYTYSWSPSGETTNPAVNLFAGPNTLLVTDANGCTANSTETITEPAPLVPSLIGIDVVCYGDNTGSITASATGGTTPYSYLWNTGATTSFISGLTAGTYSCTVTDATGLCANTVSLTLTEGAQMASGLSSLDATCYGVNNGSASVSPSGGSGNFSVLWWDGTINSNVSNLAPAVGQYWVQITDANNPSCFMTEYFDIAAPDSITYIASIDSTTCNSLSTGQISLSVTGGTSPYTYTLYDAGGSLVGLPNFTGVFTSLPAGVYSYDIIDAQGCSTFIPNSDTIFEPNAIVANAVVDSISCNGGSDGSIVVSPTGENDNFTYFWTTLGATTPNVSGLTGISYTLTITPTNGCPPLVEPFNMADYEPTSITTSIDSSYFDFNSDGVGTAISCFGEADGWAIIMASGGTGPYTYLWNDPLGQTNDTALNLTAGIYACLVTDANGCSTTDNITITEPEEVENGLQTVNSTCNGANDGYGTVVPSGVTPGNFDVYWNGTVTGNTTFTPVIPGSNNVEVINTMTGCSSGLDVFIITEPTAITYIASIDSTTCNSLSTGQISLSVTGGTSPYTYTLYDAGGSLVGLPNFTGVFTSLPAGVYSYDIIDAQGCSTFIPNSDTIFEPNAIVANAVVDSISCNGGSDGSIVVSPTGENDNFTYFWTTLGATTPNVSGLTGISYTLTITPTNGCPPLVEPFNMADYEPTSITTSIDSSYFDFNSDGVGTAISCFGEADGWAIIMASGGTGPYTYLWNDPLGQTNDTALNLTAGIYACLVTDANGCSTTDNITITEPEEVENGLQTVNSTCNGANDGYGTVVPSGVTPGNFDVYWNGTVTGNTIFTPLLPGTFTVEVINTMTGCSGGLELFAITEPTVLNSSASSVDVLCNGDATGQLSVTASGGTSPYVYLWEETSSPGVIVSNLSSVSGLVAGTYHCIILDASLCVDTTTAVTITQPDAILPNFTYTDVSCFGGNDGQAIVMPTGGNDASYTYFWSHDTLNTTNTSTVYAANSLNQYSVTITDSAGCLEVFPFNISEPALFTISAVITSSHNGADVSCNGASDGQITIIASGGNGVSYYNVAGNTLLGGSNVQGGLPAGTYSIDAYDINNCYANTLITLTEPTPVSPNCTTTNVTCNGAADGIVELNPSGGTPNIIGNPYDISWNVPGVGVLFAGSSTDPIYPLNTFNSGAITVTDANGCVSVCNVSITEPDTLTATSSSTSTTCNALDNGFGVTSDGTATVSVLGGTGPYTYLWSDGQTTATATGLSVGTYTCLITDANACNTIITETVSEPAPLDAGLVTTDVTCIGISDGTAIVNPTGFSGAYSISWTNGSTSNFVDSLPTYNPAFPLLVTITDNSGNDCGFVTENVQIGTPISPVTVSYLIHVEPSCNGDSDGQVQLTGSGGTAPYTYDWPDFNISGDTSVYSPALMAAGDYTAIITDVNGCTNSITVTMTEPSAISASIANMITYGFSAYDIECHGGSNGNVIVSVTGGVPFPGPNVYTYSWTDAGGNSYGNAVDATGLSAGTYAVTGTDFNGCPYTATITLTDPDPIDFTFVASDYNGYNIACNPDVNGATLEGIVSGGADGVDMSTYLWSTLETTTTISSLSAGNYTLSVQDNNGCPFSADFIITQPDPIVANVTTTETTCNETVDGTATVNHTGGVGPFSYIWSDGQSYSIATGLAGDIALAGGMPYTVSLTDANSCPGGTATGYVISPEPITSTFAGYIPVVCNGASTGVLSGISSTGGANTGYLYSIDGGPFVPALPSYNGLSAGSFTVVAQDVNGCLGTTVETITQSSPINPNLEILDSTTCLGQTDGILISTPTGGSSPLFDFTFSNGDVQFGTTTSSASGIGLGEYSVIVENADGCLAFDTVISVPSNVLSTNATINNVTCNGGANGSILLDLLGGGTAVSWIWSNGFTGSPLATSLSAGTYTCTIEDNQGCLVTASVDVIEPPTNLEILASGVDLKCYNDSTGTADVAIIANGQGGWSWSWTGPNGFSASNQQISGLIAGEYIVEVTDAGLCSQSDTVNINQPDSLYADLSVIDITCFGDDNGMASVIMNGGTPNYTYSWTGPNSFTASSNSISNLAPGDYMLEGGDDNGCISNDMINISEPAILDAVTVVSDYNTWGVSCHGGSDGEVTITISGGISPYFIDYNNSLPPTSIVGDTMFIFSNLAGGVATFDVIDSNGCELLATPIVITEPPLLEVLSSSVIHPSCFDANDGSFIIDVSGGIAPYTYEVNGVVMPLTEFSDGTYSIMVADNNNCEVGPISLTLTEPLEILVTAEVCLNSISIDVQNALGNYAVTWTNETGNLVSTDDMITDLSTGQYDLLIIDQPNGCVLDTSFAIELPVINTMDATCSNSSDGSIEILLPEDISVPPTYYDILIDGLMVSQGASISANVSGLAVGDYTISIMNDGSCEYNTVTSVGFVGGYDCVEPPIIISPNFDGTNDTWKPAIDVDEDIIVTIYNRWGQIEFYSETNSTIFEWDGTNNDGNRLPTADYYYVIDFINQPDKTGVITYIR